MTSHLMKGLYERLTQYEENNRTTLQGFFRPEARYRDREIKHTPQA